MSIKYFKSVCLESMVFNFKFIKAEWLYTTGVWKIKYQPYNTCTVHGHEKVQKLGRLNQTLKLEL